MAVIYKGLTQSRGTAKTLARVSTVSWRLRGFAFRPTPTLQESPRMHRTNAHSF